MAVVMMGGGDEDDPMFHDFLGMSCGGPTPTTPAPAPAPASAQKRAALAAVEAVEGEAEMSAAASSGGHGLVTGSSDLGSERQGVSNSEVFHFHGRKHAISGPEASNKFSGRKRNNSDSAYMSLIRDGMLPVGSNSPESSRLIKIIGKEVVTERPGRPHDEEMLFSMQLPPRPTSSLILQQPVNSRHDSLIPKWERSMPINPGGVLHHPSRFGQTGSYMDKLSSSYINRDTSAAVGFISQAAADEGSRTGMKGSGIMSLANPSNRATDKISTSMLPCSSRPRAPQTTEMEFSGVPSRHSTASSTRQMTIFYAGQAHVFDDVHPNKADVIMALAGSNGGSWSTTYTPSESNLHPPAGEAKVLSREIDARIHRSPLVIPGNLDYGLRQAARTPVTSDPPSIIPGCHLGGRAVGDARSSNPAAEPDKEGKMNV